MHNVKNKTLKILFDFHMGMLWLSVIFLNTARMQYIYVMCCILCL